MTKEETQQLKGIAMLMMVWLHLFGTNLEILDGCEKYIYLWNGDPLIYVMRKFARMCVVFYTFLGGYGLCKVWQRDNCQLSTLHEPPSGVAVDDELLAGVAAVCRRCHMVAS